MYHVSDHPKHSYVLNIVLIIFLWYIIRMRKKKQETIRQICSVTEQICRIVDGIFSIRFQRYRSIAGIA